MTLSFRYATETDLPAVVAMLLDDDFAKARESDALDTYRRAFAEMSKRGDNRVVLAEEDGEIVASLQLFFVTGLSRGGAKRAFVESVRVISRLRGTGVGTALMHHAIDEAGRAGCKLIQLTSDMRRRRAHLFYRRLGFIQSHFGFKLELA
ncbi:MAG: GNAT family N-acetyltransferase [Alphaproteobacteria bacterium]|nr:GNAT family N-acetyltransferase [Alphaproteobacteria bacterium]